MLITRIYFADMGKERNTKVGALREQLQYLLCFSVAIPRTCCAALHGGRVREKSEEVGETVLQAKANAKTVLDGGHSRLRSFVVVVVVFIKRRTDQLDVDPVQNSTGTRTPDRRKVQQNCPQRQSS